MPLLPTKSRTISLTLERALKGTSATVANTSAQQFANKYIPKAVTKLANKIFGAGSDDTIILTGPTAVDVTFEAEVAVEMGLFTSFLQPWFIKPASITIKGESYIGAYLLVSNPDSDIADLIKKFRQTLNDFTDRLGKPGTGERILLEIKNNPGDSRRFLGYIKSLHFGESTTQPYLLPYELTFVGRSMEASQITKGKKSANAAEQGMGGKQVGLGGGQ